MLWCWFASTTQRGFYRMLLRVIRDADSMSLPATAWPRQTGWATRPALRGHGGGDEWLFYALMLEPTHGNKGWWYSGWWYRLGCRAGSFPIKGPPMYLRVWSPGAGTPGRRDNQSSYLPGRVGPMSRPTSLFANGRLLRAAASKITNRVILPGYLL